MTEKNLDLNTASKEELKSLGPLGERRAEQIIENRPFNSWEDLRSIPGFTDSMITHLKDANATIGSKKK